MLNPVSTYRLQFHKGFGFHDLEQYLDYFKKLGIGTIYASPVFSSMPGSTHGYDTLDPHQINPEIGTYEQLENISRVLKAEGMYWLQDIVPNHMAFDPLNPWIWDLLKKGPDSVYARFFDVDWNHPATHGKLMLPFLGSTLEEAFSKVEISLVFENGELAISYYDARYPCNETACQELLNRITLHTNLASPGDNNESSEDAMQVFSNFVSTNGEKEILKHLKAINEEKDILLHIIQSQHYVLCFWKETENQVNYRRFFTVNSLISLNIQDEVVFDHFHVFIKHLVDEGIVNGLRIDHIDGLFNPAEYFERLKALAGDDVFITVEKILQQNERLPSNWKVEGTTGYDFLAMVNNLFASRKYEEELRQFYHDIAPTYRSFEQQLRDKKSLILNRYMKGELDNLLRLLFSLDLVESRFLEPVSAETLKNAIGAFLVHCPVYRYYGNSFPLQGEEAQVVYDVLVKIRQTTPELASAIDLLISVMLLRPMEAHVEYNERALYFYQRCMQFTGPLMAKGYEDTLMYTYNLFIAHNEVGDSADSPGYSVDAFHDKMRERQKAWPLSMNATSTHDTKRGEDVRARLNVLSEITPQWIEQVREWMEINAHNKINGAPDPNDEYLIYQVLMGHFPMPGMEDDDFENRVGQYLQKALREAKRYSDWGQPNEEYEQACIVFAKNILQRNSAFFQSFTSWQQQIADHGIINSLVQLLLKFSCPGIPDVYQGTELWDLSFVDPDNRRAVDYNLRLKLLEKNSASFHEKFFAGLWEERYDGRIKLWLTQQLMQLRRQYPSLLTEGEYIPIAVKGKYKDHVIAFARRHRQTILIFASPLHSYLLCSSQQKNWKEIDWEDTRLILPQHILPHGELLLEQKIFSLHDSLSLGDLFKNLPFTIIKGSVLPNERAAGILLHITSLPSAFGIGDLGPEAKQFADFLFRSYQKYWQVLPLNPTEEGQGHSPYSATSSRAGNILLISPEMLRDEGLLSGEGLHEALLPPSATAEYKIAEVKKLNLLNKAWSEFEKTGSQKWKIELELFCQKEKEWLDDFALFMILKNINNGAPWYEWPQEYKFHHPESLMKLKEEHGDEFRKIQWFQFVFAKQWLQLKSYCNSKGIELVGDLPFYVSYDSADVWSNRHLFKLDEQGLRRGIAGVPPDAFSEDGQLWGMPVFRWNELKKTGYQWWINRLQKNIELFDLVRLDHFRAFSAYWEVPASEETARNGKWIKGPGTHFFKLVKKELGELPFVAEDLGDIDEPVYHLRDQYHLPGMKVLQFAFGNDTGTSSHAPHNHAENFIVYTGTHDNNTTRGWWMENTSRIYLEQYAGRKLSEEEVPDLLCRMAYASRARIAILPLQDVLGLDSSARMNLPASTDGNWGWRLIPGQLGNEAESKLKEWTWLYNRR